MTSNIHLKAPDDQGYEYDNPYRFPGQQSGLLLEQPFQQPIFPVNEQREDTLSGYTAVATSEVPQQEYMLYGFNPATESGPPLQVQIPNGFSANPIAEASTQVLSSHYSQQGAVSGMAWGPGGLPSLPANCGMSSVNPIQDSELLLTRWNLFTGHPSPGNHEMQGSHTVQSRAEETQAVSRGDDPLQSWQELTLLFQEMGNKRILDMVC